MATITTETAAKLLTARSYAADGDTAAQLRHQAATITPGQTIHLGKDQLVVR
ncbi:hypothetical protein ABZU75_23440 [Streptosporangium sp. NPDC005286]|uniref:hypothetical protein n=1 Tax=Streptosporangium sp. NPDC005286 TaxID=3154463 RepID=UPI0033AB3BE1